MLASLRAATNEMDEAEVTTENCTLSPTPRVRVLRAVGEVLLGEPGALGVRLGDIDALNLENHGARAVVAAGNHHAVVRGPAVHD